MILLCFENAIYIGFKNDVSFLFQSYMTLYEHQSTYNPNMPLRDLIYITRQYEKYVVDKSIYLSTPLRIPTPRFVIFYNGMKKMPEEKILKLSDLYDVKTDEPELELRVKMLNINLGYNNKLMETCKVLNEYCQYVSRVREYAKEMPIAEAVDRTVVECIKEGILSEFLKKQRAEVVAMSIFEYDEEEEWRKIREGEYEIGKADGEKIGEKRGNIYRIIMVICRKLAKHQTISQIADALEETEKYIDEICKIAEKYAPDYDVDAICDEVIESGITE